MIQTIKKYWEYDYVIPNYSGSSVTYGSDIKNAYIEYDIKTKKISLFRSYIYNFDEEDEGNVNLHFNEIAFEIFLKQNTFMKWDRVDNTDPMCPGENISIGFFNMQCTKNIIVKFKKFIEKYNKETSDEYQTLKNILDNFNSINQKKGWYKKDCCVSLGIYEPDYRSEVKNIYRGQWYCLIHASDKQYYCDEEIYEKLNAGLKKINYYECRKFIFNKKLIIQGYGFYGTIAVKEIENGSAKTIEEAFLLRKINEFMPYASARLKGFSEFYVHDMMDIVSEDKNIPLIITEGMTDWMYMEWAWRKIQKDEVLSEKYKNLKIEFYHYASENYSGSEEYPKIQMDCNALMEMCRSYACLNRGYYIFVSDRDIAANTEKMSENDSYRFWGNGVYSFVLPVPKIREKTPDICIEHYFTDEEIKTPKKFKDGSERRLYISSEFDKFGRAPNINRFCTNRSACSGSKIKILDGSGKDQILNLNDVNDKTNYGLSKMLFAESVINDPDFSHIKYDNFTLIFDMIQAICYDIKERRRSEDATKRNKT